MLNRMLQTFSVNIFDVVVVGLITSGIIKDLPDTEHHKEWEDPEYKNPYKTIVEN